MLPGYTGYVPTAKETYGVSHYGNIEPQFAQTGHKDVKGDALLDVQKQVKAGYSGHVARARDTFGLSHYGVGSHDTPDGYKKAAPKRNLHGKRACSRQTELTHHQTGCGHPSWPCLLGPAALACKQRLVPSVQGCTVLGGPRWWDPSRASLSSRPSSRPPSPSQICAMLSAMVSMSCTALRASTTRIRWCLRAM